MTSSLSAFAFTGIFNTYQQKQVNVICMKFIIEICNL
jgi:hypothetical protein